MTEQTITSTPSADLRRGFKCLAKGIVLIFVSIGKVINHAVYKYPWAFIVGLFFGYLVVSFLVVGKARSERDAVNKKNYELQQKIEQLQMAKDAKEEVRYVCTD